MELPAEIRLTVACDGRPAAGVPVRLVVDMRHRTPFSTLPRLTDASGALAWTAGDMAAQIEELRRAFPHDYGQLDKHASGRLLLELLGERDLEWAGKARTVLAGRVAYPTDYDDTLDRGLRTVRMLAGTPITTTVEPPSLPAPWSVEICDLRGFVPAPSRESRLLP